MRWRPPETVWKMLLKENVKEEFSVSPEPVFDGVTYRGHESPGAFFLIGFRQDLLLHAGVDCGTGCYGEWFLLTLLRLSEFTGHVSRAHYFNFCCS